jgi:hypothetical protein
MLVARGLYRSWLARYFSKITLAGLAPDDEPILLRKIFVPLILTSERISDYAPEEKLHQGGMELAKWLPIPWEAVLLVSGEAGSGKTTLVSAVVDSLAGDVGDEFNQRFEGYVPFPIRLREAPLARLNSLHDLVNWWLDEARRETPELEPLDVRAFLDWGRGILLLDGLDEVGTVEQRNRVMSWLKNHPWVQGAAPSKFAASRLTNFVVVTTRPSGLDGLSSTYRPSTQTVHVAPFSKEQIRSYLTRWFELRTLRTGQRQETVDALIERLTSSRQAQRLLPLARRPAYLASLAFVHGTRGDLPYTRAALYELLVDAYIEMLDRQRGLLDRAEREQQLPVWDRQEKIEVLAAVAFQAHVGATAKEEGTPLARLLQSEDRRILWSREELESAVRLAVQDGADRLRTIRPEHVPQLTNYFIARTGLLVETRESKYQFGHLSFQEYLTALFILNRAMGAADKAAALERTLFPRLREAGWLEVGVLALAIDSGRSGGKGHQPILALLDLRRSEQLEFLSHLLSGEEIRFTVEERRAWLHVWLAFWAARQHYLDVHAVLQFPPNHGALQEAWFAACHALTRGVAPLTALDKLVQEKVIARESKTDQSGLELLLRGQSPLLGYTVDDRASPQLAWRRGCNAFTGENEDLAAARLVVVPRLAGFAPQGAEELLLTVARSADLFEVVGTGQIRPTLLQRSLESWIPEAVELFWFLAERTPLPWWLVEESMGVQALQASKSAKRSLLLQWRINILHDVLRIEQCWRVSLMLLPAEQSLALDVARARKLVSYQIWDIELEDARRTRRNLELARDLDGVLTRDLTSELDMALARSRVHSLLRTRDSGLARALEQDLAQEPLPEKRLSNDWLPRLAFSTVQSLALAAIAKDNLGFFSRPALIAQREILRHPEVVAKALVGTPFFPAAIEEWQQSLASPFSPLALMDDALSRPWDELPASTEGIVELYRQVRGKLEKGR